jgi:hypothetical protein
VVYLPDRSYVIASRVEMPVDRSGSGCLSRIVRMSCTARLGRRNTYTEMELADVGGGWLRGSCFLLAVGVESFLDTPGELADAEAAEVEMWKEVCCGLW